MYSCIKALVLRLPAHLPWQPAAVVLGPYKLAPSHITKRHRFHPNNQISPCPNLSSQISLLPLPRIKFSAKCSLQPPPPAAASTNSLHPSRHPPKPHILTPNARIFLHQFFDHQFLWQQNSYQDPHRNVVDPRQHAIQDEDIRHRRRLLCRFDLGPGHLPQRLP